jgi:hypothetical protein
MHGARINIAFGRNVPRSGPGGKPATSLPVACRVPCDAPGSPLNFLDVEKVLYQLRRNGESSASAIAFQIVFGGDLDLVPVETSCTTSDLPVIQALALLSII